MELKWATYRIHTVHPFGISRSTHTQYQIIFVYIIDGKHIGRGEAAPNLRYHESPEAVINCLESQLTLCSHYDTVEKLLEDLMNHSCGLRSLEAAFSMAALDWWTQKQKVPLYSFFHEKSFVNKTTSFTIALGNLNTLEEKLVEAESFPILKVKLGSQNDKQIINKIRNLTDKTIRIDANEGWDLETAIDMTMWLADKNIELIEQPLKTDQIDETALLRSQSSIPIFADESVVTVEGIPKIAHAFDGINIKLMKCGSLIKVFEMINCAKKYDLKIMIGCMVESSVGITAAAHLSTIADYIDLDGNLLINNDPYRGVSQTKGVLQIPDVPGLGLTLISSEKGLL